MLVAAEQLAQLQQAHREQIVATSRQAAVDLQEVKETAALEMQQARGSAQDQLKSRCICCCLYAFTTTHQT